MKTEPSLPQAVRILVLGDGKPGHLAVAEGCVRAIESRFPVQREALPLRLRWRIFDHLLRRLVNTDRGLRFLANPRHNGWLRLVYRRLDVPPGPFDCIVSGGGVTGVMNAILARRWGAANLYASSLRGLRHDRFVWHLCLAGRPRHPNSLQVLFAPTAAGATIGPAAATAFLRAHGYEVPGGPVWAVLIGGEADDYIYPPAGLAQTIAALLEAARRQGAHVLLTTSRRTSAAAEAALAAILPAHAATILHAVLFGRQPERVVGGYLSLATTVFVTEESGSMIAEAVCARRPVYTLHPDGVALHTDYAKYVHSLVAAGLLRRLAWSACGAFDSRADAGNFRPLRQTPFEVLAEAVAETLRARVSARRDAG